MVERRVGALRELIRVRRVESRMVGGEAIPLGEDELRNLSALGYAVSGEDASQPGVSAEDRLCLDGCVWR